jgi:hypothetical protein
VKPLRGVCVLVLERDGRLAHEVSEALQDAGASVIGPYGNAATGLDAAGHSWPDCALLDVQLCDETSFAPAHQLQRLGVPVIFLTGRDAFVPDNLAERPRLESRRRATTSTGPSPPFAAANRSWTRPAAGTGSGTRWRPRPPGASGGLADYAS